MRAMPPAADEITNLQSLLATPKMLISKKDVASTIATTINCPTSKPTLKAKSWVTILSSFPRVLFRKFENPRPWISPKNSCDEIMSNANLVCLRYLKKYLRGLSPGW